MAHTTTAQQGPEPYAEWLIRRKAKQLVGRAGFTASDRPDIEQELHLDLLRRLPRLDESRAKRTTFIRHVVENRVASLLAERTAASRDYRRCTTSLDEPADGDGSSCATTVGDTLDGEAFLRRLGRGDGDDSERHDLHLDVERVLADLPDDARALASDLMTHSTSEVARRRGVPHSSLRYRIGRLREQCEGAGLGIYAPESANSPAAPVGIQCRGRAAPQRRPL